MVWLTSTEKMKAISMLESKSYSASPLKRVYIEKYEKKKRPLSIPTIKDRPMQALYLLALEPIAETNADVISFGFRKYRSAHDAQRHIHNLLSQKRYPQWIIEGDIKACFDKISHEWMIENIPMDKKILNKFLKAGYLFDGKLFPTTEGAAQSGLCRARYYAGGYNMSNELRKKLYTSLFNTEMTKYDISKIGIERSSSDDYLLKIDVHCYTVEQVNKILNRILAIESYHIDSIEVIHGYHNGSAIKDFLQYSYRHKKINSLKLDLVNEGVTHIYLRKSNMKNVKKIKSGNRIGCNVTSKNKNLTDPFEEPHMNHS